MLSLLQLSNSAFAAQKQPERWETGVRVGPRATQVQSAHWQQQQWRKRCRSPALCKKGGQPCPEVRSLQGHARLADPILGRRAQAPVEYYSAKKKEIVPFVAAYVDLQGTMLS